MKQFIEWNTLPLKKYSGREALRCPACDEVRTDKKDKSLKIQHDKGFGSCFYCKALTFRDSVTDTFKEKVYTDLFIGPPKNPKDDSKFLDNFKKSKGYRILSGGTTANIIAREIKEEIIEINLQEIKSIKKHFIFKV